VTHSLSGENYNSWKKAIKMTLLGKNKFGFMDGSVGLSGLRIIKKEVELIIPKPLLIKKLLFYGFY